MGVQTDKILKDIQNGKIDDVSIDDIDSIDSAEVRAQIAKNIDTAYPSRSQFAAACGIQASQLSEYLKGRKNFGRDNLLTIFITLQYNCDQIQDTLKHLGEVMLYARNRRDRRIIKAVSDGKSLDEIDQFLTDGGFEPISPDAKEAYKGVNQK